MSVIILTVNSNCINFYNLNYNYYFMSLLVQYFIVAFLLFTDLIIFFVNQISNHCLCENCLCENCLCENCLCENYQNNDKLCCCFKSNSSSSISAYDSDKKILIVNL